jgi:hypothetical protein
LALAGELFLEAVESDAGARIAGRDGTAGAGIAAFKVDFADGEADDAAFVLAEELVFPEGGNAVELEGGAKAAANIFGREAGESLGTRGKPVGDSLEGRGGDDGGTVGDGVVGESAGGIANDDLLLEEDAEPFGGVFVVIGEGEGAGWDVASIVGDSESDGGEVGGIARADEMDGGSALAVDPFAIDGIKGPGAIESQATGRGDAGLGDGDGVERFDGVEADVSEPGGREH